MDLPILRYPTFNVGTIRVGTGFTFVPDRCHIEFDRQVLPGEDLKTVGREIEALFGRVRQEYDITINLVKTQQFSPWEISQQDPVVDRLRHTCHQVLLKTPDFSALSGYCQVELLAKAGIPSVVFGPGADSAAHAPDEHVAIQKVLDAAGIYALLAHEFVSD